ncbi:hypothetical protein ACIQ7Q_14255 [Streptomyces sp. NPDC096176]
MSPFGDSLLVADVREGRMRSSGTSSPPTEDGRQGQPRRGLGEFTEVTRA